MGNVGAFLALHEKIFACVGILVRLTSCEPQGASRGQIRCFL